MAEIKIGIGKWVAVGIGVLALITLLILNPLVVVRAGYRGVVLSFGAVSDRILDEGLSWIMPIQQSVKKIDVSTKKVEKKDAEASSKDLQVVHTSVTLNYRLDPTKVNKIYQQYLGEESERVILPTIEEFVKKTSAHYTAEELITKRESVKKDLKDSITASLAASNIIVTDIYLTDFGFSKDFNASIETKVKAEQVALTEKNNLEAEKFKAQQKIVAAEARAREIKIQAEAVQSQGGKDYVQLKAVEKWDGKLPVQMIPGGTVPFINLKVKE